MELAYQIHGRIFSPSRKRLAEVINACYPQFIDKMHAVKVIFKTQNELKNKIYHEDIVFDVCASKLLMEFKPKNIMPCTIEQAIKIMPFLDKTPSHYQDIVQNINNKLNHGGKHE